MVINHLLAGMILQVPIYFRPFIGVITPFIKIVGAHFACVNWNMPFQMRLVKDRYDHGDLPLNLALWTMLKKPIQIQVSKKQHFQKSGISSKDSGFGFWDAD